MNISEEHGWSSVTASSSDYDMTASSSDYDTPSRSLPTSSSSSYMSIASTLSSVYYSPRIQSMIDNQSRFSTDMDRNIEYSRDHWSELTDSSTDSVATPQANRAHFEKLKAHPRWGGFFKDVKVELGEKINEGAQAEIYDAKVEFEDGRKSPGYGYHVVKIMKGDCPLEIFRRQWPVSMLCNASKGRVKGPLMWIEGGTMVDDRFAFVMVRQWGDLRKLIDMKMRLNNNRGPPFTDFEFVRKIMLCIARDMDALHTKYKIVHRDLKASNVLLWSFGEQLPDANPHVKASVVDYECSVGVVGTGFWRAPEIIEQVKKGTPSSKQVFTFESDVYSYGMVCYELLTGRIPFEGHYSHDIVLAGQRPELPQVPWENRFLVQCVEMCWSEMPWVRPKFSEIVKILEAPASPLASSSSEYYSPCVDWVSSNRDRFASGWETASSGVMLRKWGDLRKFIDMKRQLSNNQGPPFVSFDFVRKVMLCIAKDMDALHTKDNVVHRDLRASNVLLWSVGDQLPDANPHVRATVVDYKCWSELVGPGLLSAPEILELLKEGTPSSEMVSTCESDVYNYGTVCYELLTGHTMFEGNFYQNLILDGNRPELPQVPWESRDLVQCVEMCWSEMPWLRPTFSEIVKILEAPASSSSSSSPGNRLAEWLINSGVRLSSRRESFPSGVMVRRWGDLRKHIDMKMRLNNHQGPAFASFEFVRKVMLCIARDMDALHTKYGIVHRDLKASNVLLWSSGDQLTDANPHVKANVPYYQILESCVRTDCWRFAPEILERVKWGTPTHELEFTYESDVYSYGMVCYELLTGRTPFEGRSSRDYDAVIRGDRPELPQVPWESRLLVQCVRMCWSSKFRRPTFSEIVKILEAAAPSTSSSVDVVLLPAWAAHSHDPFEQ